MAITAKVQLVRIQLMSGTVCALQLTPLQPSVPGEAVAAAEMTSVPVELTVGLQVGKTYKLTLEPDS